ncbi:VOC family protein [Tunturibacter empetritectus]|uniref:Glyoxalase superfamily protein PhnB n=1 Tax=Tunturiibacter empetritectus TaxID=3069691 RepID=A0A7W8IHN8_9BACT|nr:VOC family protein [Edaphobacter lichenicola]MBB5317341.1 putative glyoxalase superfamily protein PhnB [Edaphobacter lichenicola]
MNTLINTPVNIPGSTIIPSLRYRDALGAIDWLVAAFGFKKQAVFVAPDNKTVQHAQLTYGNGMIMLGSVDNGGEAGKFMVQPDEIGFRETQGAYLVVPDADAVYATAKAAGAEMVIDIRDMDYGGRHFSCRDLEGHMWGVGTYDPWQPVPSQPKPEAAMEHAQESAGR